MNSIVNRFLLVIALSFASVSPLAMADEAQAKIARAEKALVSADADLLMSYRRVLPLEGGSNFRDLGGYKTEAGKQVVRGKIFRSGAMVSLTEADQEYLNQFDFQKVVDLRSDDEIELFPNYWANTSHIEVASVGYSMRDMMAKASQQGSGQMPSMEVLYAQFHQQLKPQIKQLFDALLANETPLVYNCSAGQDRTGFSSALLLTTLGVPRDVVVEDYLLSTDFRRPAFEMGAGKVDLVEAAKTNDFAKMMLGYMKGQPRSSRPNPLVTPEGVPFLEYALNQIEKDYGSVEGYLKKELGYKDSDFEKLKALYLI